MVDGQRTDDGPCLYYNRAHTGQGNVREFLIFQGQGIVREFHIVSGKNEILSKCQGIVREFYISVMK